MKKTLLILCCMALVALPLRGLAQSNASLPYQMVLQYFELFDSLAHLERLVPSMSIASTQAGVAPQDVEFRVTEGGSWQRIRPDEQGIIEFPRNAEWESLVFLTNQPKGTLQLMINFSAEPLTSKNTDYQDLMTLRNQFAEAMSELARLHGQPAPEILGLSIAMPEGSNITIESPKTRKPFERNAAGLVLLRYDQKLWDMNPPVVFSELPVGILPLQKSTK